MPRNGDGSSDNGPIEGNPIAHGAGNEKVGVVVDRAKKTAEMPEVEKGAALESVDASGQGSEPKGKK